MSETKLDMIRTHDVKLGEDLGASIKSYLLSGEFSDLVICSTNQEFKVHRLIICGQSEYFTRLFKGDWVETTENIVSLQDDDPCAVEAMIHFMYGFDYDSSGSDNGRTSPMLFNVKVYQIADKYAIPHLKRIAQEKFETIVATCWQMDDFPVAIAEAYKHTLKTDRGLRDPLVKASTEHIKELQENIGFQNVLENTAGFATELALNLAQRDGPHYGTKYRCPKCDVQWTTNNKQQYCPGCNNYYTDWKPFVVRDSV